MISINVINPVAHSITQMLPMWLLILSWYISILRGDSWDPGVSGVPSVSVYCDRERLLGEDCLYESGYLALVILHVEALEARESFFDDGRETHFHLRLHPLIYGIVDERRQGIDQVMHGLKSSVLSVPDGSDD